MKRLILALLIALAGSVTFHCELASEADDELEPVDEYTTYCPEGGGHSYDGPVSDDDFENDGDDSPEPPAPGFTDAIADLHIWLGVEDSHFAVLDFGDVEIGSFRILTFRIHNNTETEHEIVRRSPYPNGGRYRLNFTDVSRLIPAGGSMLHNVIFEPKNDWSHPGRVVVEFAGWGNVEVELNGRGVRKPTGKDSIYAENLISHELELGPVKVGRRKAGTITLTNTSHYELQIDSLYLYGGIHKGWGIVRPNKDYWRFADRRDAYHNVTLRPRQSLVIGIELLAETPGPKETALIINHQDQSNPNWELPLAVEAEPTRWSGRGYSDSCDASLASELSGDEYNDAYIDGYEDGYGDGIEDDEQDCFGNL